MRKLAAILLMILALAAGKLCALAMGQEVVSQSLAPPTAPKPAGFVSGWRSFPPIREVSLDPKLGSVLADIEAHCKSTQAGKYGHDAVLWAHEATHTINNEQSKAGTHAFYCLKGRGAEFVLPEINKSQVEAMVPQELRGHSWQLYMTGMNPDYPMVILDEWVAYINGAQCAAELYGKAGSTRTGTIIFDREYAVEFAGYSTALLQTIDRFTPRYPDRDKLAEFIGWNLERTIALTQGHTSARKVDLFAQRYFVGNPRQCFGSNCQVQFNGQQWYPVQGPQVPASPGPATPLPTVGQAPEPPPQTNLVPVTRPPATQPPVPAPQVVGNCNCRTSDDPRWAALYERLDKMEVLLAKCGQCKGSGAQPVTSLPIGALVVGVPGPQGPPGQPGANGTDGKDGKDGKPCDINAVAAQVARSISGSIRVQVTPVARSK